MLRSPFLRSPVMKATSHDPHQTWRTWPLQLAPSQEQRRLVGAPVLSAMLGLWRSVRDKQVTVSIVRRGEVTARSEIARFILVLAVNRYFWNHQSSMHGRMHPMPFRFHRDRRTITCGLDALHNPTMTCVIPWTTTSGIR
jgi:hypothetical protein